MIPVSGDALALLNALSEPAVVITSAGRVDVANRAALARFGLGLQGGNLAALCQDPGMLHTLVQRASGSRQPLPGKLQLFAEGSPEHFRVLASLLTPASDGTPARLFVRFFPVEDQRFSVLTDKVKDLNAEIRRRQHTQAVLEETLKERNLLLRELHHRVKNNMQMLSGMLLSAQREAANEEARAILGDASGRLAAVGAVQQMLYGADSLAGVRTEEFLQAIVPNILQASGQQVDLRLHADAFQLANDLAVPVALILNELIANALKYGRPTEGMPEIRVRLELAGSEYVLVVTDNGPGFDFAETRKRASGLGLVRGLVRQLGGTLSVEKAPGARVIVRFWDRSMSGAAS